MVGRNNEYPIFYPNRKDVFMKESSIIRTKRDEENISQLSSDNIASFFSRSAFLAREVWINLPIWYFFCTVVFTAMMAILYFNPSRHIMTATAVFPLCVIILFFYAYFSSDPSRTGKVLKPVLGIGGTLVAIVLAFNLLSPVWNSEVIIPIKHFYPNAKIDPTPQIKDGFGKPILDANGVPLTKKQMMTAPDGRQYRVEGKLLINLEYKKKLIAGYEPWCVFWLIALVAHCWYWRGKNGLIKFFVATLIYGFLLESSGVVGDYFRENDYNYYLPMLAAPIATMAGWPIMFYTAISLYEVIEQRWQKLKTTNILIVGLIISLIALFWDLNIDPVATGIGFWTWHELLTEWYLGVPLLNFTSWLSAVFAYGVAYTFINRRSGWSDRKKIVAMFVMIPLVIIAGYLINFIMIGLCEGFDGPSWQVQAVNKF